MSIIVPQKDSALNLTIRGTVGEFQVRGAGNFESVKVKYISTYVAFKTDGSNEEKLLNEIIPVREIFDLKSLAFEELVQRDIDDSRVSTRLIPYLLEASQNDLVKFFPPIIAVVVPLKQQSKSPADYYGPVKPIERMTTKDGYEFQVETIGALGQEYFQFKQLFTDSVPDDFNYAELKINTSNTKLVIVDGQHRAMAMLALYRNIKGWGDRGARYEKYYNRWTAKQIADYDLKNVKMPMLVCTFPELGDNLQKKKITVTAACRSIFLALNKNAKPVSRSKNLLLDDRDIISELLRCFLNRVKNIDSTNELLKIANFELDSTENKVKIQSPLAISSVMHIYAIIEKLLLTDERPYGLMAGSTNLWKVKNLDSAFSEFRLDGFNILGSNLAGDIERNNYSEEAKNKILDKFSSIYGDALLRCFKEFAPYREFVDAVEDLRKELITEGRGDLETLLFDTQGSLETFRNYVEELDEEYNEKKSRNKLTDGFVKHFETFRDLNKALEKFLEFLDESKAKKLYGIPGRKISSAMIAKSNDMFSNTFTSNAFQNAFIATFFFKVEELQEQQKVTDSKRSELLTEYISCLNKFFEDDTGDGRAKRILATFAGAYSGTYNGDNMRFNSPGNSYRGVLVNEELSPSQWYKFRPFFLELWTSSNPTLNQLIEKEILATRTTLFHSFNKRRIEEYCELNNKAEDRLTDQQKEKLKNESLSIFREAIKGLSFARPINDEDILSKEK